MKKVYCILISGFPAVGKSTMAQKIAERLKFPIISKDSIKEILFDTIGFKSREEKLKLGVASTELMYYSAEKLIQSKQSLIIDNNFEKSSRAGIELLISKYDVIPITICMNGDITSIYFRFIERDKSPDRHKGHISNVCYPVNETFGSETPIDVETFEKRYTKRGMNDFVVGHSIYVDATDPLTIDYDEVLSKIRNIIVSGCD